MNPRILFISNNCFSVHSNNGKTFKSLFSNYKKDDIAQIYFTESSDPDFTFCNNYFLINDKDVFKNIFSFKNMTGRAIRSEYDYYWCSAGVFDSKFRLFNPSLLRLLRDFFWSFNSWKSRVLLDFVSSFNPDYIFFVGGPSKFSHDLALFMKNYLNKPLIVFFTDDYLLYPKVNSIWELIQKFRILRFYRNTIEASSLCITVGKKMSRVYSLFFKRKFETIMNSVPLTPFPDLTLQTNKLIISYFGSLHTNRWRMVVRLGKIILNTFSNQLVLHVYSAEKLEDKIIELFKAEGILFKGAIFGDNLSVCMQKSDVLLHVESDDQKAASITRLSVSTKIPEYLMSGKPILAFGPKYIASMELLTENNICFFLNSEHNQCNFVEELRILLDHTKRVNIAMAGYNYAISNFDNEKNVLKMQSFLKTKI